MLVFYFEKQCIDLHLENKCQFPSNKLLNLTLNNQIYLSSEKKGDIL